MDTRTASAQLDRREQMVAQQVRAWEVLDARVLALLRSLPRENFVPAAWRGVADADTRIALAHGQHMLAPKEIGRILQALELRGGENVLEIGTGSGYLTACLAASARRVRSLEIFPDIAEAARANLRASGVANAEVVTADGSTLADSETWDAIVLTGSLPVADEGFQRALQIGGRLFVVVGSAPVMEARLVRRVAAAAWSTESLFETVFEPLLHARTPEQFTF